MRKRFGLLGTIILFAIPVMSQTAPKAELFGGYSYLRFNPGNGEKGVNLNGWNASIAGNFNDWFGLVGEFSGHYGKPQFTGFDVDTNVHSFLFGPRFSYRKNERITPFAHALFGATRFSGTGTALTPQQTSFVLTKQTAFAMAIGGGVDARINDSVAVRVFQADYQLTRMEGPFIVCITIPCPTQTTQSQHNVRISAGIVLRFGK
jgi:opacity protein-like surface antigen